MTARRLILEHAQHGTEPPLERRAALRRVERCRLDFPGPDQVDQRTRGGQHAGNRLRPARAQQVIGILPFRQKRELEGFSRLHHRQRHIDGTIGCLATGIVTIEAQGRLVRHAPEQHQLVFGESRAQRSHRVGEAGQRHGDDIDIAFNGNDLAGIVRYLARIVMVVK